MAGPKTAEQALACAKAALLAERWFPSPRHFVERMLERRVTIADVKTAIGRSSHAESYEGKVVNGGTTWRIIGPDCDGETMIGIGVEIFGGVDGKPWFVLITVFDP